MLTDWLLRPWEFVDASLLSYVEQAHQVLLPHKDNDIELYIELAACLGVLKRDVRLVVETSCFIEQHDWERALQIELKHSKNRRYPEDVKLHVLILRAWFVAIADQFVAVELVKHVG